MNKKVLMSVLTVALLSVSAAAADYANNQGDVTVSAQLGLAIPTSDVGDIDDINIDKKYGKMGVSGGVQGLFALTDHLSLGLEFNAINFGSKDIYGLDWKVNQEQYMVAGRFYVNPTDQVRLYVPLGVGLTHTRIRVRNADAKVHDDSFALYAGLGVETNLSERVVAGLEGRFNHTKFDKEGYDQKMQYVNVLARIGYKF